MDSLWCTNQTWPEMPGYGPWKNAGHWDPELCVLNNDGYVGRGVGGDFLEAEYTVSHPPSIYFIIMICMKAGFTVN